MSSCFGINRFHACVLLCWQFAIFFASQMLFPIFSNFVPRWRCNVTANFSPSFDRDCAAFSQCPEGSVEFEPGLPFRSAALEFDWICGPSAYKRALFSQAQFAGVLVGTLSFGTLSDAFGRRPVALLVLGGGVLAITASAMAPNWPWLLASRLLVGLCIGGTLVVVCTFVMELILPAQRMVLRAFINWGIARLALTLLCWLFPDWRSASIACALCSVPAFLLVLFVFPESPTWLHSKGRLQQMSSNQRRIARFAGNPVEEDASENQQPAAEDSAREAGKTIRDLVHERALLRRVVVLWAMWFTAAICGYSIDLNSSNISGDLFLNQSLLSLLIAFSKICLVLFDSSIFPGFSRRNLHQWSQLVVVGCFLVLSALVLLRHDGIGILLANLAGTVFIEFTWDACYLCAVESVPTSLRGSSVGSCSLMARAGALLAPVLVFLNTLWPVSAYLAVVLLGSLNWLISWLWLVETKGVDLDAVADQLIASSHRPSAEDGKMIKEGKGDVAEAERMLNGDANLGD